MNQDSRKMRNNTRKKDSITTTMQELDAHARKKETIRLYEKGLVRDLLVPSKDTTTYPVMLDKNEYERLKEKAKVMSEQERKKMQEAAEAKKHSEVLECLERKDKMRSLSLQKQKQSAKLNEFESEAKKKILHQLRRAFELRQEQEDEVKKANRLIMATKCHAIRDAQIAEKEFLKRELEEEERRLDQMMEDERRRALLEEEKKEEKKRIQKENFVKLVTQQMKQNETEHILAMERKEEEARLINEANFQIKIEEFEEHKKKLAEQEKMREELNKINSKIQEMHEKEIEEQRLEDLRIEEFIRRKAEREEAWEIELQEMKKAKDREISRLHSLQQRQSDLKAEMDEINAKRIQDEVERKWRVQEKEKAEKKLKAQEALKKAREAQVEDQLKMKAMQIAREKQDYERVLKIQRESFEKQKTQELKKRCLLEKYRSDIMRQINAKEMERIQEKQKVFQEGIALKLEAENRKRHIREVLDKKIQELRHYKVPEEYISEIEREIKHIAAETPK